MAMGEKAMNGFYFILLGMAAITFTCRYFFLAKSLPYQLGPKMQKLLSYTAPSVLTAMWVPIVFLGHKETGDSLIQSPFLIAGVATVILSYKVKNTLVVVIAGVAIFSTVSYVF